MFGTNKIELCQKEMCAAMQQYIDSKFKVSPGKVTSVCQTKNDRGYGVDPDFVLCVVEQEKPVTAAALPSPPAPPPAPANLRINESTQRPVEE